MGRPGAADPADETRLDDLTDPNLAPGAARNRRAGAAAQAPAAPTKRGRRDPKPPKVKSKRKALGRGQDSDLPGANGTAAATSAAATSAPSTSATSTPAASRSAPPTPAA
ncbi:MAG TPA: hypothetical protein VK586_10965, partial [Streptosporangiaceae bacterium]|nr:hypothetical protein [Streptosporangiaceae bacterium]